MNLLLWLDILGIVAFAVSGALLAGKHHLDIFGVVVMAIITALGGGTIRDVLLNSDMVFWINQPRYLVISIVTALVTYVIAREPGRLGLRLLLIADAIGIALFAIIGTQKALTAGVPYISAVVLGTITCVAGGMMRDTLCNEIPMVLKSEIYAVACIAGSVVYCVMLHNQLDNHYAAAAAFFVTFTLRVVAVFFNVSFPAFTLGEKK